MAFDACQEAVFRERARHIDGIDVAAYARHGRDPLVPIIGRGDAGTRVGFFGRDPGRDEVRYGEPFIGAGGQQVRRGLHQHLYNRPPPDFEALRAVGPLFFWANTVPYKPVGNKAWPMAVKRYFQPLMMSVLATKWRGEALITLGRDAFLWFGIDQPREQRRRLELFWRRNDRFQAAIDVTLAGPGSQDRAVTLYPLPHPSPLNAVWYKRFPSLLQRRLQQLDVRCGNLRVKAGKRVRNDRLVG